MIRDRIVGFELITSTQLTRPSPSAPERRSTSVRYLGSHAGGSASEAIAGLRLPLLCRHTLFRFRPAGGDERQYLLDQAAGLGHHFVVTLRRRAQDEFGDPRLDVFADALDDRRGVADREIILRVAAGAFSISIEQRRQCRGVGAAKAVGDAGAVMIAVDRA